MTTTDATSLAAALRSHLDLQPGERLYGIVDACQDKDLAFEARDRFKVPIRMLFQGNAAQYMDEVAPYLIPIDPASDYLESWAQRWGKNVGILLTTPADPAKLLRHLRDIFVVKDEAGQNYFFRFYDPRVLRPYLPTCTAEQAKEFFGPVSAFLCETETPDKVLRASLGGDKIREELVALSVGSRSVTGSP